MMVGQCYAAGEDVVCPQIFPHAAAAARHSLLGFAKKLKRGRVPIDIVRAVEGNLKMSKLVHYHRPGENISEGYIGVGLGGQRCFTEG